MTPGNPRPAALTTICIIAIVLGSLGTAAGVFGVLGLLLQDFVTELQEGFERQDPQVQQLNRKMAEITRQYAPLHWIAMPLNAVVSLCLLIGGIMSLRPNRSARQFLMAALVASIPLDLGLMAIGALVQLETMKIVEESMPTSGPPMGPFMRVAGMAGLVVGFLLVLAKLFYYGWGVAVLRSAKVRAWDS